MITQYINALTSWWHLMPIACMPMASFVISLPHVDSLSHGYLDKNTSTGHLVKSAFSHIVFVSSVVYIVVYLSLRNGLLSFDINQVSAHIGHQGTTGYVWSYVVFCAVLEMIFIVWQWRFMSLKIRQEQQLREQRRKVVL